MKFVVREFLRSLITNLNSDFRNSVLQNQYDDQYIESDFFYAIVQAFEAVSNCEIFDTNSHLAIARYQIL